MNLALHGFLLQVILSLINFKHGFRLCSAGEPGYLDFDNLPETNFSCQGKVIGGYYADVEAGCQMFHVCTIGQKDEIMDIKFLCLNGTVFDQETRVCERVDEVDCSKSERFYNLNLELYGNHAVTLSLHEEEDDDDSTEPRDDPQQQQQQQQQQQHMTSAQPSTTSTTTTTTSRPSQPSTTSASNVYQQHPTGYPQHYQPRPSFPSVQTSQSNTHYDDKNGGYHHQYIFHSDERNNNNQATSYQLFSNQGVSSTTPTPQVHQQVRYSSTASPQVIHNEPSTVTPLQYHVQSTSSTIQTLLNNNANNPSIINPLFHNHGIASTTEQFNVHNNNPREIAEYQDNSEDEDEEQEDRRPLEAIQSTNQGKVSKLTISPVPQQENRSSGSQSKPSQNSQQQQQQRISINYLPTPSAVQTTISAFYPTQRPNQQKSQQQQNSQQVTQHIHVPPPPSIPQLKPHQITINLPPPDIQRIVQNPSPLLPSQSRVIVTAKASVSDESGRPLNASQLITLPLPTIPSNYDDYREGDESFDPFYRDVPKIRNDQRIVVSRKVESSERKKRSTDYNQSDESYPSEEVIFNAEIKDIKDLKANLPIIKAILFGLPIPETEKSSNEENTSDGSININETIKNVNSKNESRSKIVYEVLERTYDLNKNISGDTKSVASQIEEEEYVDVQIPDTNEKSREPSKITNANVRSRTVQQRVPSTSFQREVSFDPIVIKHDETDTEPKDTVQLFLRGVEGNNSSYTGNSSIPIESLNYSNETIDINNKTDKIKQEVLQTRSSSNSNKSNRRKHQNNESLEEYQEYIPRRSSRINKPKSSRYYDEYDVSESIEQSSRQRANRLRQRPSDRRNINYRDDYVDEELDGEYEYDDENVNKNRKTPLRRGPQGRRVSYRNRNRHLDYEDVIEVDEKPRVRTKTLNTSSRSRNRSHTDRFIEDRRRRPESERRNSGRRRQPPSTDDIPLQIKNDDVHSQTLEDPNKALKMTNSHRIVQEDRKDAKYTLESTPDRLPEVPTKKRLNSLDKDKESVEEEKDQHKDDYLNTRESYAAEYNESGESDVPEDYVDYTEFRDQIGKVQVNNRQNKNRFDEELESIPPIKSHRQDKSRKFIEESRIDTVKIDEKIKYEDTESTTLSNDQEPRTTNVPIEYTIPDDGTSSQEYDDYNLPKTTSSLNEYESTDVPELKTTPEDVTTEGILKYTDEIPQIEKKDDTKGDNKQKEKVSLNVEDYVDDNYEPESYTEPKIKEHLSVITSKEENDKHILIDDQPKEQDGMDKNSTVNTDVKTQFTDEYYDIYDDKIESTTASLSSEEYDELETTTDVILTSTSAQTSTSTVASILSTTIELTTTSFTTSPTTTTTSTTTTTPVPTIITTTTSTTTSITPMSSTVAFSSTPKARTTAKYIKPVAIRKNYVYTPPSTTQNPVVIRRGQPLTGPKPTKPPPSYNELAAKPLIRRLPLLSRTTTTTSEATILEEKIVEELSKHLMEERDKNIEENNTSSSNVRYVPSSFSQAVTPYSVSKPLINEEFDSTTPDPNDNSQETSTTLPARSNQIKQSVDQGFNNEVPKQTPESNDSNNVPEKVDDSSTDLSKTESTTKIETTTKSKLVDIQTTTVRTIRPSERRKLELTSVKTQIQKSNVGPKRTAGFNCLEKEMYRFYGDVRDCRLFHYCSPGFTTRQVLDFRFVCEEGTIFDEESQSCRHDVPNPKCVKRTW